MDELQSSKTRRIVIYEHNLKFGNLEKIVENYIKNNAPELLDHPIISLSVSQGLPRGDYGQTITATFKLTIKKHESIKESFEYAS